MAPNSKGVTSNALQLVERVGFGGGKEGPSVVFKFKADFIFDGELCIGPERVERGALRRPQEVHMYS